MEDFKISDKMKNLRYKTWTCLLLAVLGSSCRKYVEVDQYSNRTLKYTSDFQYVINNRNNFEPSYILPTVTSDDIATTGTAQQNAWNSEYKAAYVWAAGFYGDTQTDIGWNNFYKTIYTCNEVIFSVMSSENGTKVQKDQIYAEALVNRAFAYLMLVNQYGEIYDPAKATTQIGVPLLTTPDLYQKLNRASLSDVYGQIVKDVEQAIPLLPNTGNNNGHVGKVSAYALLSRCYLYMRNFALAGDYADKALALNSSLNNLTTYVGNMGKFPLRLNDPEVILSRLSAGQFRAQLNPELINLFQAGDLRLELFTGTGVQGIPGRVYIRPNFNEGYIYTGLNVPEMMLNRAEVYARAGDIPKTLDLLNKLRQSRFTAVTYQDLSISNPADLLPAVINERRRELMATGLRWFDMRRLNLDAALAKPVVRTFLGQDYTLNPGSNRYLYPIAPAVLNLNPEIQQSPR